MFSMDDAIAAIVSDLYETDFAQQNVDLQIEVLGALNYVPGAKLRLTFVDMFNDADVTEWQAIVRRHGATCLKTRVRTSRGEIDLNIEYKSRASARKGRWLFRSAMIAVAAMSYLQLHQLQEERYPFPSEWFA